MKKILIALSCWLCVCQNVGAQDADAILGKWMDEKEETIIEIYSPSENFYNGKIVWLRDSIDAFGQQLRDVLNGDVGLRSRKVLGTDMLQGFAWDGADTWRKGRIYYYHSGNNYNGRISLNDEGDLRLKGYFSFLFFLGRTQTWKRVSDTDWPQQR